MLPIGGYRLVVPNVPLTDYYQTKLKLHGLVPGQPFPNDVIPPYLFDPNGVTYLTSGVLPKANVGSTDYNVASVPLPQRVEDTVVRGDYNFNDRWALLVHYIGDHQPDYGKPELGWCGCDYNTLTSVLSSPAHSATAKLTALSSPTCCWKPA